MQSFSIVACDEENYEVKGRDERVGEQQSVVVVDLRPHSWCASLSQALEVRSFKSVLLGQKNCEVKDLFSANPQLMTISINFNGSLKLSIVITWKLVDIFSVRPASHIM